MPTKTIPRFLPVSLTVLLIGAGVVSAPFLGRGGPLPATEMLDIWIIGFAVVCFIFGRVSRPGWLLLLGCYAATRVIPAIITDSPLRDFLRAYRWLFYVCVLLIAEGKHWGEKGSMVKATWLLLSLATIKGILTRLLLGAEIRPGLIVENNFEIALFCGLSILVFGELASVRHRAMLVILVSAATLVSGSRSGIIALLILIIYVVSQAKRVSLLARYLLFLLIPLVSLLAHWVFSMRSAGGTTIDRFNFFNVFLRETSEWTPLQWLFGTIPITPLSYSGCNSLAYFQALFSTRGDGSCYSVILHAFSLRIVFDAGLFGLVLAFGLIWKSMRSAGVSTAISLSLLAIAFTNGLSVSGPNNPYVILPILLAILFANSASVTSPP